MAELREPDFLLFVPNFVDASIGTHADRLHTRMPFHDADVAARSRSVRVFLEQLEDLGESFNHVSREGQQLSLSPPIDEDAVGGHRVPSGLSSPAGRPPRSALEAARRLVVRLNP